MQRHALRLGVSVITFLLGLTASNVSSLFHLNHVTSDSRYEREVLAANDAYLDAHVRRDVAALDDLLADEFTVSGRVGRWTDKAGRLALVANPEVTFVAMNAADVRVTASETTGAVSGRGTMVVRYRGHEYVSPPYLFTRNFVRRDGRWQVVSVQVARAE